jgi:hypothetical protein
MLYKPDSLETTVNQMRSLGQQLIPFNTPKNEPDINILKMREVVIDGYEVCVYYTKSRFEEDFTEIVQIWGKYTPFVPFNLVCKLAKAFLGNENLSLVELFRDNRKVYCWAVNVDADGRPLRAAYTKQSEDCTYEGFNYCYMQPSQVNFY